MVEDHLAERYSEPPMPIAGTIPTLNLVTGAPIAYRRNAASVALQGV